MTNVPIGLTEQSFAPITNEGFGTWLSTLDTVLLPRKISHRSIFTILRSWDRVRFVLQNLVLSVTKNDRRTFSTKIAPATKDQTATASTF